MSPPDAPRTDTLRIRQVSPEEPDVDRIVEGLVEVLIDCVDGGASVGFMLPLSAARAERFWRDALDAAARGERVVLVAIDAATVVGTVQLVLATPENQPHRGEISKMLVHRAARRRGVADALMLAAEHAARAAGRTLLVLDTASAEAERLYERHGFRRVGAIPGFALLPEGGLVDTVVFYKPVDD